MKPFADDALSVQALDADLDLARRDPRSLQQIAHHQAASRALLERTGFATVRYGELPWQSFIEITPSGFEPGKGVVVFVHGGYWRAFGAQDFVETGKAFLDQGKKLLSIDYPLAPQARMADIVGGVRQAIAAIASRHPGEPVWAVGHSAGAHLVAACCCPPPPSDGGASLRIERAYLLSGLYDLRPMRRSFLQDVLHLGEREAQAYSPVLQRPDPTIGYWLLHGAQETGIFKAQSEALFEHLTGYACRAHRLEVAADHFSIMGEDWLRQAHAAP